MSEKLKAANPLGLLPHKLSEAEKSLIREALEELHPDAEVEQLRALRRVYGWGPKEACHLVFSW